MTNSNDANRARLVAQLYDDWHGHYVLRRIEFGRYVDVRPIGRAEALTITLRTLEALLIVYPHARRMTRKTRRVPDAAAAER